MDKEILGYNEKYINQNILFLYIIIKESPEIYLENVIKFDFNNEKLTTNLNKNPYSKMLNKLVLLWMMMSKMNNTK